MRQNGFEACVNASFLGIRMRRRASVNWEPCLGLLTSQEQIAQRYGETIVGLEDKRYQFSFFYLNKSLMEDLEVNSYRYRISVRKMISRSKITEQFFSPVVEQNFRILRYKIFPLMCMRK